METTNKIISYLRKNTDVSIKNIALELQISERTILRYMKILLGKWTIIRKHSWRSVLYNISPSFEPILYFDKPYFQREKKVYNKNFIENYIPNKTCFLWDENKKKLHKTIKWLQKINTINYQNNIRQIENILIDLSFASSNLEWNTYSYLDTEVLIKYNEKADNKTIFETNMIINHKNAIQYILEIKQEEMKIKHILSLHRILSKNLLPIDIVWKIRNNSVQIGWSSYTPLSWQKNLNKELDLFLNLYKQIQDPFEQAIFSLVFLSYFQLFHDCNKRVSRLFANISLLKHWLPPISLLQIKKKDYIDSILAIYELNNPLLLSNLFVENYLLNYKRYVPVNWL